jgi:hypothetical protein
VVAPGVMVYLNKARSAFKTILKNPMAFANNLVSAAKLGFSQFGSNFVKHLKAALIGWLTGALAGAGVYIPQGLTLLEIGKFVLSVLGITWPKIRAKIAKVIGDTAMNALETGFELVKTLVTGGPAAAWELIKEKLANLRDTVMQAIISFVTQKVVEAAITKLLSMLSPVGAFIQAIIGIYNSVMFFVERLKQIAAVVAAFIDSISAIASGVIAAAANRVESTLGGLLTLVISFLARFAGLGKISGYISEKIQALQARVDTAIDSAVAWIVTKAKAFLATLMGKGKDKKPDERTEAEKTRDKKAAIGEAEKLLTKDFDEEAVIAKLGPIKSRYKLLTLDLVVDTKNDTSETVHFTASASAVEVGQPKPIQLVRRLELVRLQKAFIAREKDGDGKKLPMTVDELKRQVAIQQAAMRQLSVKEYRANWQKFYPVGGKKGGRSDSTEAAQQRAFQVSLERGKAMDRWHIHNPGKIAEGRAFVDELFKPRPGDKSYPFMHKSLPDANGVEYVNGAYGMAILHALDQGAGGGSETAGLGGARENSSIGAQWDRGGRAKSLNLDLEAAIGRRQEKSEKVDKMKLFVELPVEVR